MEITNMTFLTLIVLCLVSVIVVGWLFKTIAVHDKIKYSTLNEPLKNKNKPWYTR